MKITTISDDSEYGRKYRELASRLRDVAVVDARDDADAVITDDVDVAGEAAAEGRHVLLDVPCRVSAERLAQLDDACRRRSRLFMPGHRWRFKPSTRAVREALDAGSLGEPGLLRIHRWEHRVGEDGDGGDADVSAAGEIDTAIWLFGGAPETIYAVARERYLQVHLGFAGGGMTLIDHVTGLPPGDGYSSLSLIGSTGAAYADDHHDMNLLYSGRAPAALRTGQGDLDLLGQLADLVGAIRDGREPAVTADATRLALAVLDTVRSSARDGRVAAVERRLP